MASGRVRTALFVLGVSALFTHELDAVRHSEWQLLFVLSDLPERTAYPWFVGLHLPLFAAILWLGYHSSERIRGWFRLLACGFFVVHGGLHLLLADADGNEFAGVLSYGLIGLAALCGAVYVLLSLQRRRGG